MSRKIVDGEVLAIDDWLTVADGDEVPRGGRVIVSLARLRSERAALLGAAAAVGVRLPNTVDVDDIWPEIADRPLLALSFPTHGDGRALSQANVLRNRLGYRGEVRATGDVTRDLVFGLRRCGVDVIAPRDDQNPEDCLRALRDFSDAYQPAADHVEAVFVRRRHVA